MNAAAATMMAFTRRPLLRMQMLRDVTDDYVPGIRSMGFYPFFRYVLSETVVFIVTLQVIDAFTFFRMSELMWNSDRYIDDDCRYYLYRHYKEEEVVDRNYKLAKRRYVIGGVVLTVVVLFIIRLFALQILSDDYRKNADSNAFLKKSNIRVVE